MIGIVIFLLPLNEVAVPVTPPEIAIVLAVAKVVALSALVALVTFTPAIVVAL